MRSIDDQQLALQCVNLAGGNLDQAKRIMDFVTGEDGEPSVQGLSPEDVYEVIRDLAICRGVVETDRAGPQPQ